MNCQFVGGSRVAGEESLGNELVEHHLPGLVEASVQGAPEEGMGEAHLIDVLLDESPSCELLNDLDAVVQIDVQECGQIDEPHGVAPRRQHGGGADGVLREVLEPGVDELSQGNRDGDLVHRRVRQLEAARHVVPRDLDEIEGIAAAEIGELLDG